MMKSIHKKWAEKEANLSIWNDQIAKFLAIKSVTVG